MVQMSKFGSNNIFVKYCLCIFVNFDERWSALTGLDLMRCLFFLHLKCFHDSSNVCILSAISVTKIAEVLFVKSTFESLRPI